MSRLRQFGFALGIACVLAGTAGSATASGGRHPLFDDQGTLVWYTSLDEAQAVARATGKMIFIEQGRLHCPNCRSFVERVLPVSSVRARIADIAIGLADDADEADPRVNRLLMSGISNPTMLPLCGFVTPELKWSSGWSGYMDVGSFGAHLGLAERRFLQVKEFRDRRSAPPAPVPACPTPTPQPTPRSTAKPVPTPAPSIGGHGDEGGECEGGVCRLPPKKGTPTPDASPAKPAAPTPILPVTPPLAKTPPAAPTKPPVVEPATPPVAKAPPAVPTTPPVAKAPPVVPTTPPVAKAPPVVPTTPPVAKAPPVVPATPPVAKAPPAVPATPPVAKAPPAVPTTPPVAKAPPVVPATPPVAKAPPVAPTTPPVVQPATPPVAKALAPRDLPPPTRTTNPVPPMDRARRAAADGRWGEVLKIADASPSLTTSEKVELDGYVRRANDWVQQSLASVVTSAKERQFSDARRTLTVLTMQLDGTTCPGLIDAERGSRAVERLSAVEQGSPDRLDAPEQIRKQAYSEFRGTRWAPLFRQRATP